MTAALRFENVAFSYGGSHASGSNGCAPAPVLAGLSFTIPHNGLVALLGPNGAGKSTLLRLCSGLLPAAQGSIEVAGRPLTGWPRRELARQVAFVPQQLHLPFPFTVEQVVAQGRTPHRQWLRGLSTRDHAAVDRALECAGIRHLRHRPMNQISGGEQQKVKLAIALAQEAPLLLLDEPFQHLDIGSQSEFLELLLRLHQQGLTVISAMHDLTLTSAHFPLALLLTSGTEYAFGPTEKILTRERIMAAFRLDHRAYPGVVQI